MYVSGLRMGLTTEDLRTMPLMRLSAYIAAYNGFDEEDGGGKSKVRQATQDDIRNMLM